jgi:hypothetical protein
LPYVWQPLAFALAGKISVLQALKMDSVLEWQLRLVICTMKLPKKSSKMTVTSLSMKTT